MDDTNRKMMLGFAQVLASADAPEEGLEGIAPAEQLLPRDVAATARCSTEGGVSEQIAQVR